MKKIVLSLLMVFTLAGAHAQIGTDFGVNMFMTTRAGVGFYQHPLGNTTGFSGGIGVGKWILNPLAGHIALDFMSVPSVRNEDYMTTMASASAEFLWDFNATFFRVKHWRVNVYPMIGLGITLRSAYSTADGKTIGTDREVHGMLGLNIPVRLGYGWDFTLQYKGLILPESFDAAGKAVFAHSVTGGFTHNFTESPFNRRTEHESRSTSEDWFIGIGLGPNYSAFELFTNPNQSFGMVGVAPEIMFGRNFSNFWTIRFEGTGLIGHEAYDTVTAQAGDGYTFTMIHADVLLNFSHLFNYKRGVRWNFLPYLGAGAIWRYDNVMFDMAADFGLMTRYYLNSSGDLFIDLN